MKATKATRSSEEIFNESSEKEKCYRILPPSITAKH